MLKEQINTILKITCLSGDEPEIEDQILNLFKAEVDKLTVISWERIRMVLQEQDKQDQRDPMFRLESIAESQLQHTKKQLLDLMGE